MSLYTFDERLYITGEDEMTVFLAFIFFKPSSTDKLTAVLCTPISLTYSCTFWGSCITNMETAALAEQFHDLLFSHIDAKPSDK